MLTCPYLPPEAFSVARGHVFILSCYRNATRGSLCPDPRPDSAPADELPHTRTAGGHTPPARHARTATITITPRLQQQSLYSIWCVISKQVICFLIYFLYSLGYPYLNTSGNSSSHLCNDLIK